jgi:hypothetical protein
MSAIQDAISLYGTDFPRVHGMYILSMGIAILSLQCWHSFVPAIANTFQLGLRMFPKQMHGGSRLVVGEYALNTLCINTYHFPCPLIGWAREFKGKPTPRFYNFNTLKEKLNHGQ